MSTSDIHEEVRLRYAQAAVEASSGTQPGIASGCGEGGCCAPGEAVFGAGLYGANEQGELPEQAVLASLGCGNPTAVAELREGETVLDLGSGGGIDVLLSARRVGPTGKAYGVDMTEEMLALARRNAADAGATNVEFLKGRIEEIPLPAQTVDVVISNCVVNLSPDKEAVLRETFRVLQGRRTDRDQRCRRRGSAHGRGARRARRMGRLHRRRPVGGRVPAVPGRRRVRRGRHPIHPRGGRRPARRDRERREAGRRAERHPGVAGGRRGRLLLSAALTAFPRDVAGRPPMISGSPGGRMGPSLADEERNDDQQSGRAADEVRVVRRGLRPGDPPARATA